MVGRGWDPSLRFLPPDPYLALRSTSGGRSTSSTCGVTWCSTSRWETTTPISRSRSGPVATKSGACGPRPW